jgi:hypothetical protein
MLSPLRMMLTPHSFLAKSTPTYWCPVGVTTVRSLHTWATEKWTGCRPGIQPCPAVSNPYRLQAGGTPHWHITHHWFLKCRAVKQTNLSQFCHKLVNV